MRITGEFDNQLILDLIIKYRETKQEKYLAKIIEQYTPLISKIVSTAGVPRFSRDDLMQEGRIGLIKAVNNFDLERETVVYSYIKRYVHAEILDYVINNYRQFKFGGTKPIRKAFYNYNKFKEANNIKFDRCLNQDELKDFANSIDIPIHDAQMAEDIMMGTDAPYELNEPDNDEDRFVIAKFVNDKSPEDICEENEIEERGSKLIQDILDFLPDRTRDIIVNRYLVEPDKRLTLNEMGQKHSVSAERIRQIEKSAIEDLQTILA